jgi:hypothetical protein
LRIYCDRFGLIFFVRGGAVSLGRELKRAVGPRPHPTNAMPLVSKEIKSIAPLRQAAFISWDDFAHIGLPSASDAKESAGVY